MSNPQSYRWHICHRLNDGKFRVIRTVSDIDAPFDSVSGHQKIADAVKNHGTVTVLREYSITVEIKLG